MLNVSAAGGSSILAAFLKTCSRQFVLTGSSRNIRATPLP
jgi:hypothetical protein